LRHGISTVSEQGTRGEKEMAKKTTREKAASKAPKVLRNPKSTKKEKSAAASAVSQVGKGAKKP